MRTVTTLAGGLAVATGASAAILTVVGGPPDFRWLAPTAALAYGTTGWVVARRGRAGAAGLVLALIGSMFGVSGLARCLGMLAVPGDWPGAGIAVWLGGWLFAPAIVSIATVLPLLLPDGRLPSRRWWPGLALAVVAVVGQALLWATTPYGPGSFPPSWDVENPVGVAAMEDLPVVLSLGLLAGAAVALSLSSLVVRWRRVGRTERQQIKWIVVGCVLSVVVWALAQVVLTAPVEAVSVVSVLPVPVCCAVAALRHRLWDVDLVISRALVIGSLSVLVLAIAAGLIGLFGGLLGLGAGAPVLAAALGVVVVVPLHDRVRRLVNRAVHGEEDDPATALSRLGERLGAAADDVDPEDALRRLVVRLVDLLSTSYAAIDLRDGAVAVAGVRPDEVDRIPLQYHGVEVGALLLARRSRSRREWARLHSLAVQAGAAAHAVLMGRELRRARMAASNVREEERRRLRRDLHDGLGPILAASVLEAETALDLVPTDPARATGLLARLVPRLSGTVDDVRALVHDLRPPSLDELGLEGAVQALVVRFRRPGLAVELEMSPLGQVPPAVDVAAYRIVSEAVTNADRHADARTLHVVLRRDGGWLGVEVSDDGRGIGSDAPAGVGLASMRERAREIDGDLVIAPADSGRGTMVRARLPLGAL